MTEAVLPDVLARGLAVVFCGTAASPESARLGAYYAGPGNRFWEVLYRTGLTPRRLRPAEFREVARFGIGLTDIVKTASGRDAEVPKSSYDVAGFAARMERARPRAIGFNGKNAARACLGGGRLDYGRQARRLGAATLFVLPSTSAAARRYWDDSHWRALAGFVGRAPGSPGR